jgi:nitrate reductase gamma subunit
MLANMTLPPLLTLGYWFSPLPLPLMPLAHWVLFSIFALMAAVGLALLVWQRKSKSDKLGRRVFGRIASLLITMGLIGLLLRGLDYERVYLLSMRAFYLVWLIAAGLWGWSIYIYATKTIPAIRAKQAERESFEKWLPKKK